MALKDWKKDNGNFLNNKTKSSITIHDYSKIGEKNPFWINIIYSVNIEGYGKTSLKKFKSKPQALKYAKAYMRKH